MGHGTRKLIFLTLIKHVVKQPVKVCLSNKAGVIMPLEIIYPICCGIDVHKSFIVACISSTDKNGSSVYFSRTFTTFTKDLLSLVAWLKSMDCHDVCMESTGKYWIPIFNILEKSFNVVVPHPKYVKAIRGKKTDTNDARWIADLFKHSIVRNSFIPTFYIRQLRDLTRYDRKLTGIIAGEKNRALDCLTVSNIKLDDVLSDVFGASGLRIMEKIIENQSKYFDVAPYVNKHCKTPISNIQDAIDGKICDEQIEKLKIILTDIHTIQKRKESLMEQIEKIAARYEPQIQILTSMPGIKRYSAIIILAEIGVDMLTFKTHKHLCSWAGLAPQSNESAGKKKSNRTSSAGSYLKPVLMQCALAVCRSNKQPELKAYYQLLKIRRGHQKAIIATCRKMLTSIYFMLLKNKMYDSSLFCHNSNKKTNKELNTDSAIDLLTKNGYLVIKQQE